MDAIVKFDQFRDIVGPFNIYYSGSGNIGEIILKIGATFDELYSGVPFNYSDSPYYVRALSKDPYLDGVSQYYYFFTTTTTTTSTTTSTTTAAPTTTTSTTTSTTTEAPTTTSTTSTTTTQEPTTTTSTTTSTTTEAPTTTTTSTTTSTTTAAPTTTSTTTSTTTLACTSREYYISNTGNFYWKDCNGIDRYDYFTTGTYICICNATELPTSLDGGTGYLTGGGCDCNATTTTSTTTTTTTAAVTTTTTTTSTTTTTTTALATNYYLGDLYNCGDCSLFASSQLIETQCVLTLNKWYRTTGGFNVYITNDNQSPGTADDQITTCTAFDSCALVNSSIPC